MPKFIDLTGKVFGKWTILSIADGKDIDGHILWRCQCSCGVVKIMRSNNLKNGRSKSCQACNKTNKIHGYSRTKTYRVWGSMIERCENTSHKYYKHYGGRGIKVCKEWRNDFTRFLRDMGEQPKGLSLDRIDNSGDYCKDNCRWVSMKVQNRNRRDCLKQGDIVHGWKTLKRLDNPNKTQFQCTDCGNIIIGHTHAVKSGLRRCQCRGRRPRGSLSSH